MNTIENYEQDGSAQGRLQMWTFAINVAKDRPINGGGFGVFRGREDIYEKYNPGTRRRNVQFRQRQGGWFYLSYMARSRELWQLGCRQ